MHLKELLFENHNVYSLRPKQKMNKEREEAKKSHIKEIALICTARMSQSLEITGIRIYTFSKASKTNSAIHKRHNSLPQYLVEYLVRTTGNGRIVSTASNCLESIP